MDDGFIWLRNEHKDSEHTDPIEDLGEKELVNQSATYLLLHASARVIRMSEGLPLPLPQEPSVGDSLEMYGTDGLKFSTGSLLVPSGQQNMVF